MKKLINKIRNYFLNRKISKMMQKFLWEINSRENREKIRLELSKMIDAELRDNTDPDLVNSGGMSFTGYSPKRKKEMIIMINTRNI